MKLHWQIGIAILCAIPVGMLGGDTPFVVEALDFLGSFFIQALKMLIVPLIVSAIIVGMSNLGSGSGIARLGGKTLGYYLVSSLLAILTGLFLVNLTSPGLVDGEPAKHLLGLTDLAKGKVEAVSGKGATDLVDIFLRMVPPNIVSAAAEGKMLGLITFSLVFGFFINHIGKDYVETQRRFWNGVYEVMLKMTNLVMFVAPIGVFGLIGRTVAKTGFDAFEPLMVFFFTVLGALLIHVLISMPLILRFVAGRSPVEWYKTMAPALLTAFSTSSSSATLPETIQCAKKGGVSERVSGFVLPLGATVNMDGTALYECVAAMFICQAYGIELGLATQFMIVLIALLTSIGVAGIPSASLVAIVLILSAVGLPAEGIGLILAVDRILDMCRTSVNVFSDSCGAAVVEKLES